MVVWNSLTEATIDPVLRKQQEVAMSPRPISVGRKRIHSTLVFALSLGMLLTASVASPGTGDGSGSPGMGPSRTTLAEHDNQTGAEALRYGPDVILFDGFESGDTCRWIGDCPPPANDTCASPIQLIEDSETFGWTIDATDDYGLSCLVDDSADTVYEIALASQSAVLVRVRPQGPSWELAMALRDSALCPSEIDIACEAHGKAARYINIPNLDAGVYDVIVDGDAGSQGDFGIRYTTRIADATFGYWVLETTDEYSSIAGAPGATSVVIPITPAGVPTPDPGDEWWLPVNLPFSFDYFGTPYMTINVTSNLLLTFDAAPTGSEAYDNDCLDSSPPTNAIALFWDDGITREESAPELWTMSRGSEPDRSFTIEFKNWDLLHCDGALCYVLDVGVCQQVILHETGDIELRYGPRHPPTSSFGCGTQHTGCSATIGIEGQVGGLTDADLVDCLADNTTNGRNLYFVTPW